MRTLLTPLALLAMLAGALAPAVAPAQPHRPLLPIDFVNSAEFRWLGKTVHDSRTLDDIIAVIRRTRAGVHHYIPGGHQR